MLDTTLATTFLPGSNLKGELTGANWIFLLPSLELDKILCLGLPPRSTLIPLSQICQEMFVLCAGSKQEKELESIATLANLKNIIATEYKSLARMPAVSLDLALLARWPGGLKKHNEYGILAEIQRLLKPEAHLYFESGGPLQWLINGRGMNADLVNGKQATLFWITPIHGEMHTAVLDQDKDTISFLRRRHLYSPSVKFPIFHQAQKSLNERLSFSPLTRRFGILNSGNGVEDNQQPPAYIRRIAGQAGINVDHYRWALAATGDYSSRKLIFYLFPSGNALPEYVVKLVRNPALNARLENEYSALSSLASSQINIQGGFPKPAFFGYHAGLAILGETFIDGTPFRKRSLSKPDCPFAEQAATWLTDLAIATHDLKAMESTKVVESLEKLFTRFLEIYNLPRRYCEFLNSQIESLRRWTGSFPVVFQHGDPGTWNLVVTQEGKVAFLDWEAAEQQGVPLWDLFYFLRSFTVGVARAAGFRDSLRGFKRFFLEQSPMGETILTATRSYCQQVNLPAPLIEPLFYTCWMHRALKEANRLSPARLEAGHYVNLLRLCIEAPREHTLKYLFSLS